MNAGSFMLAPQSVAQCMLPGLKRITKPSMSALNESKKNGVIYTKDWIASLMLDIMGYKGVGILDRLILEPSCGTGVFLGLIAARLAEAFNNVGLSCWHRLADCVIAFEIDGTAAQAAKNSAVNALSKRGCPEKDAVFIASSWVHCRDFLLSSAPACDFAIGNPPYVRATDIRAEKREMYIEKFGCFTRGCDLYIAFYDRALELLKSGGKLAFICADRWMHNAYGKGLRGLVNEKFSLTHVIAMHNVDAFSESVSAYPAITVIENAKSMGKCHYTECGKGFAEQDVSMLISRIHEKSFKGEKFTVSTVPLPAGDGFYRFGIDADVHANKWRNLPTLQENGIRIGIGVATGCDRVFVTTDANVVEPSRILPLFYMRDFRQGLAVDRWLINPWEDDGSLVDLQRYPRLKKYLEGYYDVLSKRHVVRRDARSWYRTIDKINPSLMKRRLLLLPDMSTTPDPVLSTGKYPHHNCYWLCSDTWDMEVLGGILMSDHVKTYLSAFCVKMRGGTLRFQAQYLRLLRLPFYASVPDSVRAELVHAFRNRDRILATKSANKLF